MQAALMALVLVLLLAGLIATRIRPPTLFLVATGTLYFGGLIPQKDLLTNFVNPSLITLLLLLVGSIALEKTPLITGLTRRLFSGSLRLSVLRMTLSAGLISAVANNTAVVASLMAAVRGNGRLPASKLLIPLSYAAILGGVLTLVGTSTNLIVDGFVRSAGLEPLHFFDFTWVGVPIFLIGVLVLTLVSIRFLPSHQDQTRQEANYFLELVVEPGSPLIGKTVLANGLRHLQKLFLVELIRGERLISPVGPDEVLQAGDVLVFSGDVEHVPSLASMPGLSLCHNHHDSLRNNLVEVVITNSALVRGKTLKDVNFRAMFDAGVVAIKRGNQQITGGLGNFRIEAGDVMVLAVGPDFKSRPNLARNFIVVGGVDVSERLPRFQSGLVLASFVAALAGSAFNLYSLLDALMLMVALFVGTGILTFAEVRRRLPFELMIVIGCALGLAQAMMSTGLATILGQGIIQVFGDFGPYGALIGIYLLTWLLTEVITNNAAAALAFPIALSLAQQFGVDAKPFIMTIAFAASASFLSPYGYQTNLMVYSAGNYKFLDYVKAGLPLSLVYGLGVLLLVPWVFPFG